MLTSHGQCTSGNLLIRENEWVKIATRDYEWINSKRPNLASIEEAAAEVKERKEKGKKKSGSGREGYIWRVSVGALWAIARPNFEVNLPSFTGDKL